MTRGIRRHLTQRKQKARNKEFYQVCGYHPYNSGRAKKYTPFRCGNKNCPGCKCLEKGTNIGKTKIRNRD